MVYIKESSQAHQLFSGEDVIKSGWKSTSFFGAREEMRVKVDTKNKSHMEVQVFTQNAFEHFLSWIGGLIGGGEWGSVREWEVTNLSNPVQKSDLRERIQNNLKVANENSETTTKIFTFASKIENLYRSTMNVEHLASVEHAHKETKPLPSATPSTIPIPPSNTTVITKDPPNPSLNKTTNQVATSSLLIPETNPGQIASSAKNVDDVAKNVLPTETVQEQQPVKNANLAEPVQRLAPRGRSKSFSATRPVKQQNEQLEGYKLALEALDPAKADPRVIKIRQKVEDLMNPEDLVLSSKTSEEESTETGTSEESIEITPTLQKTEAPKVEQESFPEAKVDTFKRPRLAGIRPPTRETVSGSSTQIAKQRKASPNRTLPRKPKGWIRPSLFNAQEIQARNEKIATIGREIAVLQLQELISTTPKESGVIANDFKAGMTDWLTQKVKDATITPDGKISVTLTKNEAELLNPLTKLLKTAKNDLPGYRPQLDQIEKSFSNNLGKVLNEALPYRAQEDFNERFSLQLSPVIDQFIQGFNTISTFYEAAGVPIPPSSEKPFLGSPPLPTASKAMNPTLTRSLDDFLTHEHARQIVKTEVQARLEDDINYWAEGSANTLPTMDKLDQILSVLAEHPNISPELRAKLLIMKADIEMITENLKTAERRPDNLRRAIESFIENNSATLREAMEVDSTQRLKAPTPEEKIRQEVAKKIDTVVLKMGNFTNYLGNVKGSLENDYTYKMIVRQLDIFTELLLRLKTSYKPSWIPFTPTKKIEDLSLEELKSYQSYVDIQLNNVQNKAAQDIQDIKDFKAAQTQFEKEVAAVNQQISTLENLAGGARPQFSAAASLKELIARKRDEIQLKEEIHSEFVIEETLPRLTTKIENATKALAEETRRILAEETDISLKRQLEGFATDSIEAAKLREAYVNKIEAESQEAEKLRQETIADYRKLDPRVKGPQDFAELNLFNVHQILVELGEIDQQTKIAIGRIPRPDENNATIEQLQAYRDAVREAIGKGQDSLNSMSTAFKRAVEMHREFEEELKFDQELIAYHEATGNFVYSNSLSKAVNNAKQTRETFLSQGLLDSAERATEFAELIDKQRVSLVDHSNHLENSPSPLQQLAIGGLSDEQKTALYTKFYEDSTGALDESTQANQKLLELIKDPIVSKYLPNKPWVEKLQQTIEYNLQNPTNLTKLENPSLEQLQEQLKAVEGRQKATDELETNYGDGLRELAEAAKKHDKALANAQKSIEVLMTTRKVPQVAAVNKLQSRIDQFEKDLIDERDKVDSVHLLGEYANKMHAAIMKLELAKISALASDKTLSEQFSKLPEDSSFYKEALKDRIAPQIESLVHISNSLVEAQDRIQTLQNHGFKFSNALRKNIEGALEKVNDLQEQYDTGVIFSNKKELQDLTRDELLRYQENVKAVSEQLLHDTLIPLDKVDILYNAWQKYNDTMNSAINIKESLESQISELDASVYRAGSTLSDEEKAKIPDEIAKLRGILNVLSDKIEEIDRQHQSAIDLRGNEWGTANIPIGKAETYPRKALELEQSLADVKESLEKIQKA